MTQHHPSPSSPATTKEERGWQPIETAPTDRGAVLGGWHHSIYGWVWGIARFHRDKFFPDGYWAMAEGGRPTHWHPIAAPPLPDTGERPGGA
jgi:hypothetical protein